MSAPPPPTHLCMSVQHSEQLLEAVCVPTDVLPVVAVARSLDALKEVFRHVKIVIVLRTVCRRNNAGSGGR